MATMSIYTPDYAKQGPWNTVIDVQPRAARRTIIQFLDHGSGYVSATWINTKLLFMRVWWGRIVATDLVFDVESRAFVYREMVNHGYILIPGCRDIEGETPNPSLQRTNPGHSPGICRCYTPRGADRYIFSMRKANHREQIRLAPFFWL